MKLKALFSALFLCALITRAWADEPAPSANGSLSTTSAASNAIALFQESSDALERHNLQMAGATFFMAEIRAEADFHCFPPSDDANNKGVTEVQEQNATVGFRVYQLLEKDPKVLAAVISIVDSWVPIAPANYSPGWATKSRCADYKKAVDDSMQFTMQPVRDFSRLLNMPEYYTAFSIYSDVYQDYSAPPPDDAYSAARLKEAADARKTILDIEQSTGIHSMGARIAYGQEEPLGFKVIKTGTTRKPIRLPEAEPSSNLIGQPEEVEIAITAEAFDRIWKAMFPQGPLAEKEPVVDFSAHLVVIAFAGEQLAVNAPMFINRIDYEPQFSGIDVFVRVPVPTKDCKKPQDSYPYVIAVMDKPVKKPVTTGYDRQNFPFDGC